MNYLLIATLAAGLSGAAQAQSQTADAGKVTAGINDAPLAQRVTCSQSKRAGDMTSMEPDYEKNLADMAPATSCTGSSPGNTAALNPSELLAKEPTAAGPSKPGPTRAQVTAEFLRARDAGELIWWKD